MAISGSIGMWNRAETIVRVWKSEINAATARVGASRRHSVAGAIKSPIPAIAVSPRWLER